MKLEKVFNQKDELIGYAFYCPGCKSYHSPIVKPFTNEKGASWTFNGNLEKPTFHPSVLTRVAFTNNEKPPKVCHLFVVDGRLQFLSDCTHELAGQTIEMEEVN